MALTGGRTNFADPLALGTELRIPYAPLRMDAFWAITNTLNSAGSLESVVQVSVLLPGEIHPGEGTPTEKAGMGEGRSEAGGELGCSRSAPMTAGRLLGGTHRARRVRGEGQREEQTWNRRKRV